MLRIFFVVVILILYASPTNAKIISGIAYVIDGDTLRIGGQKIRLFGVDAPETKQVCQYHGQTWLAGRDAKNWLRERTKGKRVRCRAEKIDHYGRWIAICYLGSYEINAELVRAGWAEAYTEYSLKYVVQEIQAKNAGVGIWAGHCDRPSKWRHR